MMRQVISMFFCVFVVIKTISAQVEEPKAVVLLNEAEEDMSNNKYTQAVQKLIQAERLKPDLRGIYLSLNRACMHTKQYALLKEYLLKAKKIFLEDDELCYYLGNVYQVQNNLQAAIKEYTEAIEYSKKNGEDFLLVYAYYFNRGNSYLKRNEFQKAVDDYTISLEFLEDNSAVYVNRGIAYFKLRKKSEACKDWKKAKSLGATSANQYISRYCR